MTAVDWLSENSHIIPKGVLSEKELIDKAKEIEIYQTDNKIIHFAEWLTRKHTLTLMALYEQFEEEFYPKEKL
jgi:hypothetical protein